MFVILQRRIFISLLFEILILLNVSFIDIFQNYSIIIQFNKIQVISVLTKILSKNINLQYNSYQNIKKLIHHKRKNAIKIRCKLIIVLSKKIYNVTKSRVNFCCYVKYENKRILAVTNSCFVDFL